jgi:hypothetical protein
VGAPASALRSRLREVWFLCRQYTLHAVVNINSGGYYTFALLKPGVYSIEAGAPGFDMISHKNLVLEIRQTMRQDFSLQVGGGKAQLKVLEDTPLLNADSAEIGSVISRHSMEELPFSRQNFSLLGLLVPGTNPGPVGGIRTQGSSRDAWRYWLWYSVPSLATDPTLKILHL